MRLDADDDEDAFPRQHDPAAAGDVSSQQGAGERPVSQGTDSTEAEARTAAEVTRELDD